MASDWAKGDRLTLPFARVTEEAEPRRRPGAIRSPEKHDRAVVRGDLIEGAQRRRHERGVVHFVGRLRIELGPPDGQLRFRPNPVLDRAELVDGRVGSVVNAAFFGRSPPSRTMKSGIRRMREEVVDDVERPLIEYSPHAAERRRMR